MWWHDEVQRACKGIDPSAIQLGEEMQGREGSKKSEYSQMCVTCYVFDDRHIREWKSLREKGGIECATHGELWTHHYRRHCRRERVWL